METKHAINRYKNEFYIKLATVIPYLERTAKTFKCKLYTKDLPWYFIAAFGFIPFEGELGYSVFHFVLVICIVILIASIILEIENKNYQVEIKKTCFPMLMKVFGEDIHYANHSIPTGILCSQFLWILGRILSGDIDSLFQAKDDFIDYPNNRIENIEFDTCGLYDRSIETRTDDDCIYGKYNGLDFIINETDFGYTSTDNDGSSHYHSMFKGIAMLFKISKKIKTRVLITNKQVLEFAPSGYEKVSLEYTEFEKKYQVYVDKSFGSEGQIEARYLLTPAFLDRFMQLKTSFSTKNIKLSVLGDKMILMLATEQDLFEMNHLLSKIDCSQRYERLFDELASVLSFMDVLNLSSKTGL